MFYVQSQFPVTVKFQPTMNRCRCLRSGTLTLEWYHISGYEVHVFFYRQLDFQSEPAVANEILENEPQSFIVDFCTI